MGRLGTIEHPLEDHHRVEGGPSAEIVGGHPHPNRSWISGIDPDPSHEDVVAAIGVDPGARALGVGDGVAEPKAVTISQGRGKTIGRGGFLRSQVHGRR